MSRCFFLEFRQEKFQPELKRLIFRKPCNHGGMMLYLFQLVTACGQPAGLYRTFIAEEEVYGKSSNKQAAALSAAGIRTVPVVRANSKGRISCSGGHAADENRGDGLHFQQQWPQRQANGADVPAQRLQPEDGGIQLCVDQSGRRKAGENGCRQ